MLERILRLVGPLHVIAGILVFATAFSPSVQVSLRHLLDPPAAMQWSPMFAALFGPTVASWGLLFNLGVAEFFRAPSLRIWRTLLLAVLIWFSLDTGLCLYLGFYAGAAINSLVAVLVLVALVGVRHRTNSA